MSRAHRASEILGVAAVAALGAVLGAELAWAASWGDAPALLAAGLAAWLAADAVSGVVHWWADRVASERIPWLGPNFVRPFREHHDDPAGITRHDWIETNGNTCIVLATPLAAVWWWAPPAASGGAALGLHAFCISLAFWVALTNQIHKWAHAEGRGRAVAWVQRHRLVLDPAHHAAHHLAPFDRRYCITTGWLNPALDRCRVFASLERLLGRAPRRGSREAA